jgi:pimeloyl-ACP methyl ester carboxylesterase
MFEPQFAAVPDGWNLIAVDLRGHGTSRPTVERLTMPLLVWDILAIMDREQCPKAVLVGQSLGGNIAQRIATLYPGRVTGLIFIDCASNNQRLTLLERIHIKLTPLMLALYPWPLLRRLSARLGGETRAARAYSYDALGRTTKSVFIQALVADLNCLYWDPGEQLRHPSLMLCGDRDPTGKTKTMMPQWASSEPLARFTFIPHAGHMSNLDNPEECNRLIGEFLLKFN